MSEKAQATLAKVTWVLLTSAFSCFGCSFRSGLMLYIDKGDVAYNRKCSMMTADFAVSLSGSHAGL